jgi:hypothetical protein
MSITLEAVRSELESITTLADEAAKAGLQASNPESFLFDRIPLEKALNKGADELGIVETLTRGELLNLASDGYESIWFPKSIHSVGEALNIFSNYVNSSQNRSYPKVEPSFLDPSDQYNLVCLKALNTVAFEQAVRNTAGEQVFEETRYFVRLVTELLMAAEADVFGLEIRENLQADAMNDLVNCGLIEPSDLDTIFDVAHHLSRNSPGYKYALEARIEGVKAEITTFFLVSDVETYLDLELRKSPVSMDTREGIDGILGVNKNSRGGTFLEPLLYIDTRSEQNYYSQGICTLQPSLGEGKRSIATRGGDILAPWERENFGVGASTEETVNKRKVPVLIARLPKELFLDHSVYEISQFRPLHDSRSQLYNEWLSRISLEVGEIVQEERRKE